MRTDRAIPDFYKAGVMSSIPKKGKGEKLLDNDRGITPTDGKILEHVLNNRIKSVQRLAQDDLQLGFTEGLCPALPSMIIAESIVEDRENKKKLYMHTRCQKSL